MKFTDNELLTVSELATKQVELEKEIGLAEEQLKKLNEELLRVKQVELPNALAELDLSSLSLKDGTKIITGQKYYASIPKDQSERAFSWLEAHGYDSIIKNVVTCQFGKGENEEAKDVMRELTSLGVQPTQTMSVHPMTLKSFIKDLFERGVEFPLETFGAGVITESKVVLPK